MSTIPSKQLHRVGTLESLETHLSDREIGFDSVGGVGYIKLDGVLKLLAGDGLHIAPPAETSVLVGDSNGTCAWYSQGLVDDAYAENSKVWKNIGGNKLYAKYALMDSENHFVSSCKYQGVRTLPIYGSLLINQQTASNYMKVSIRQGNSDVHTELGGLLPKDYETAKANDYLYVRGMYGTPDVAWATPDSEPTEGSEKLITSGAVYKAIEELKQQINNLTNGQ